MQQRLVQVITEAPHLAGAHHLDAKHGVGAYQPRKGKHWYFHPDMVEIEAVVRNRACGTEHPPHCFAGEVDASNLRDEREATRGAQIAFDYLDRVVLGEKLDVERARYRHRFGELRGYPADAAYGCDVKRLRRCDQRGVAAVHAGVSDMLADGPQDDLPSIRHRIDLYFPGVCLKRRDHDGVVARDFASPCEDATEFVSLVCHTHRRAAQHVARSDEHRKPAEPLDHGIGIRDVRDLEPSRLIDTELVQQGTEFPSVLGAIDVLGAGSEHLHAGPMQIHREVVRDLAAHAYDHALRTLPLVEVEHG